MAPARMVSFMKKHAKSCEVCLQDPDLKEEIAKITEIVLPESKIPKAIRQKNEQTAQKEDDIKDEQGDATDKEEVKVDAEEEEEEDDDGEGRDEENDEENDTEGEEEEDDDETDEELNLDDDPDLLAPP